MKARVHFDLEIFPDVILVGEKGKELLIRDVGKAVLLHYGDDVSYEITVTEEIETKVSRSNPTLRRAHFAHKVA